MAAPRFDQCLFLFVHATKYSNKRYSLYLYAVRVKN
jgi:hypothetical protein